MFRRNNSNMHPNSAIFRKNYEMVVMSAPPGQTTGTVAKKNGNSENQKRLLASGTPTTHVTNVAPATTPEIHAEDNGSKKWVIEKQVHSDSKLELQKNKNSNINGIEQDEEEVEQHLKWPFLMYEMKTILVEDEAMANEGSSSKDSKSSRKTKNSSTGNFNFSSIKCKFARRFGASYNQSGYRNRQSHLKVASSSAQNLTENPIGEAMTVSTPMVITSESEQQPNFNPNFLSDKGFMRRTKSQSVYDRRLQDPMDNEGFVSGTKV